VLLGFTVAAYNLDRIRSFRAKRAEDDAMPVRRVNDVWEPGLPGLLAPVNRFQPRPLVHPIKQTRV
jgi:hypothetical protein